jgi:hypothetical protein
MTFREKLKQDRPTKLGIIGAICSGFTLIFWIVAFLSLGFFLVGIIEPSTIEAIFRMLNAPAYALFFLDFPKLSDLYAKFWFLGLPALGALFGYLSTREAKNTHQKIPRVGKFALEAGWVLFCVGTITVIGNIISHFLD